MPYPNTPERFWAKTKRVGPCLEWQGHRDAKGYGHVSFQAKPWQTHRLAWMLTHGPIPDGLWVLHTCDNPPCIEPLHLFLGTYHDNLRDSLSKGRGHLRGQPGERSRHARLTEAEVREIRSAAAAGTSQAELSRRYNIADSAISNIVNRKRWRSVV